MYTTTGRYAGSRGASQLGRARLGNGRANTILYLAHHSVSYLTGFTSLVGSWRSPTSNERTRVELLRCLVLPSTSKRPRQQGLPFAAWGPHMRQHVLPRLLPSMRTPLTSCTLKVLLCELASCRSLSVQLYLQHIRSLPPCWTTSGAYDHFLQPCTCALSSTTLSRRST